MFCILPNIACNEDETANIPAIGGGISAEVPSTGDRHRGLGVELSGTEEPDASASRIGRLRVDIVRLRVATVRGSSGAFLLGGILQQALLPPLCMTAVFGRAPNVINSRFNVKSTRV